VMLIAAESFVATYGGEQVAVHRGQTRVIHTHELARRYPARFIRDVRGEREQRERERSLLEYLRATLVRFHARYLCPSA
jgi:hypothetical protein